MAQGQVKVFSTCSTGHVCITGTFKYPCIMGQVKSSSGLVEFNFTFPTRQVMYVKTLTY